MSSILHWIHSPMQGFVAVRIGVVCFQVGSLQNLALVFVFILCYSV